MSAKVIPFRRRAVKPCPKKKSTPQYVQTPLAGLFEMFEEAARTDFLLPKSGFRPGPTGTGTRLAVPPDSKRNPN